MTFHFPHEVRAVTGDTEIDYDAIADRELIDATYPVAGVISVGDLKVTQHAAGANLTVDAAAGKIVIPCTGIANGGKYLAFNDATINVNMGSPPSSGQFRIDTVWVHQYDRLVDSNTNVGTAGYMPQLEVANGTPASSAGAATVPSLPGGIAGGIEVARILRTGGESSIVTASITDSRALAVGTADRSVGFVENIAGSGTVGTSETSLGAGFFFTSVVNAARRYRLTWSGETSASTAGAIPAQVTARVNVRAGTTTAATLLASKIHNIQASGGVGQETWGFEEEIPPGTFTTGPVTIQIFLLQAAGTGSGLSMLACRMRLIDVGL